MKTSARLQFLSLLSVVAIAAAGPIQTLSTSIRTVHPLTNTRLHTVPSITRLTGTRSHTKTLQTPPPAKLGPAGVPKYTNEHYEYCLQNCELWCLNAGFCTDEGWDRKLSEVGASHTAWLNSVLSSHSAEMREQATKTEEAEQIFARGTPTTTLVVVETTPATTLAVRGETHLTEEKREACVDNCDATCRIFGLCNDDAWEEYLRNARASHTA